MRDEERWVRKKKHTFAFSQETFVFSSREKKNWSVAFFIYQSSWPVINLLHKSNKWGLSPLTSLLHFFCASSAAFECMCFCLSLQATLYSAKGGNVFLLEMAPHSSLSSQVTSTLILKRYRYDYLECGCMLCIHTWFCCLLMLAFLFTSKCI